MRKEINDLKILQEEVRQELKNCVKDKSIPLEGRWEVFIDLELGTKELILKHLK